MKKPERPKRQDFLSGRERDRAVNMYYREAAQYYEVKYRGLKIFTFVGWGLVLMISLIL